MRMHGVGGCIDVPQADELPGFVQHDAQPGWPALRQRRQVGLSRTIEPVT